ncbi:hypothetical protein [Rhodoferax sp.]|uniref:hypothetical protein n=1 Tax=Rhodoferax sp. TaxID=50421 RepID=UPI00374DEFF2
MTETKATIVFLDSTHDGATVRVYQCQRQWGELQLSGHEDVRFCGHCRQAVHRVVDVDGFQRAVAQGQCVMVAGFDDTDTAKKMFVGKADVKGYEVGITKPKVDAC